jgi:ubiquinone/menaquinone biosynthesis C-methylase UbiE
MPGADRRRATLGRSVRLLKAFRVEQTDPDRFYGELAEDSVQQLAGYVDLSGKVVLDVGGGPGYFAAAFRRAGATYVSVEADLGELSARSEPGPGSVLGSALALPFQDGAVDICYSSNVLEHVPDPERMLSEMLRVTRPGGTVFCSYTLWLSLWGGHETAPWHFLGGHFAARRYTRKHGHPPKNVYGTSLFAVSAGRVVRWAQQQTDADVVAVLPRYHPWWAWWVVRIPGLREIASWNLALVLRARA